MHPPVPQRHRYRNSREISALGLLSTGSNQSDQTLFLDIFAPVVRRFVVTTRMLLAAQRGCPTSCRRPATTSASKANRQGEQIPVSIGYRDDIIILVGQTYFGHGVSQKPDSTSAYRGPAVIRRAHGVFRLRSLQHRVVWVESTQPYALRSRTGNLPGSSRNQFVTIAPHSVAERTERASPNAHRNEGLDSVSANNHPWPHCGEL